MSRYDIDKLMRHVEGSDAEVVSFVADPASYVAAWTERAAGGRLPASDSGRLDAAERAAFVSRDYGALYAMGAHPYLLWHFMEAVWVWAGEVSWRDLVEAYRAAVSPHGYPDFAT